MHTGWAQRIQAITLPEAIKHTEHWTSSDLELVAAFPECSAEELALTLGRTLFSIQSVRERLAAGVARPRRVAASDRPYRGWTLADGDE